MRIIHEIEQALVGCWRLLRGEPEATAHFDMSADGFWRSMAIGPVLAVFDGIDGWMAQTSEATHAGLPMTSGMALGVFIVSAGASLVGFCAFPLVVGLLAKPMGLGNRFGPYIIARNWLTALLSLPAYLISGMKVADTLTLDAQALLTLVFEVTVLIAGYSIARAVLDCSRSMAIGFAILDFLLSLLAYQAAINLFL